MYDRTMKFLIYMVAAIVGLVTACSGGQELPPETITTEAPPAVLEIAPLPLPTQVILIINDVPVEFAEITARQIAVLEASETQVVLNKTAQVERETQASRVEAISAESERLNTDSATAYIRSQLAWDDYSLNATREAGCLQTGLPLDAATLDELLERLRCLSVRP